MAMKRNGVWILSLALLSLTSMAAAGLLGSVTSTTFQGSVFCLSGSKATPLPGAKARIECRTLAWKPVKVISGPANANGFYTATASGITLQACKAFLHSSPSWGCRFPTDANGGKSGSPVIPISVLSPIFSCKPFFYAPS